MSTKKYGSFSRLTSIGFKKNLFDVYVVPNSSTTITADRVVELPAGDADQQLVSINSTDTLINKTMSGSNNTFSNIPISALTGGPLAVNKGGTNSSTALNNNRVMRSDSGQIIEAAAITAARALISDANGIPTHSAVTSTELGYVSGVTSAIQTQFAGKISADGSIPFSGNQSMGSNKLTNVADPTSGQDAATKNYVDLSLQGVKPKQAVKVATTANITLSGTQTIDGVSVIAGDRVLVKDQTTTSENGIYVAAAGAWSRASDFDAITPVDEINGSWVGVQSGTTNTGKVFIEYAVVVTVGTDPILFTYFNALSGLLGGDMITITGSTVSVDLATVSGLESTNPGNAAGQLRAKVDGSTLEINGSNQLQVKDGGITDAKVATGIDAQKIGAGSVSNTEFGYLDGVTSAIQTQLNGKASTALNNLTVSGLAAGSLLIGASSSAVQNLAPGSNGEVLTMVSGAPAWAAPSSSSYKVDWVTGDGVTKTITHNLGTLDVMIQVYDKATGATIGIDDDVRTSTNVVTVTATEAPGASGWRVLILAV
jgi:hypothetical protein